MKKIFTLILAAAMAAPVVSAEDIKMSVYERSGGQALQARELSFRLHQVFRFL